MAMQEPVLLVTALLLASAAALQLQESALESHSPAETQLHRFKRQFGFPRFPQSSPGRFPQNQGGFQNPGRFQQNQGGFQNPGRFPTNQGGFPQNQGGFPQNQGGFPQNQGGFPQNQGGFPQNQGGFPQNQGGFPQNQGGFPQNQGGFPQNQGGFPQNQGGFPQNQGGFPQNQGGFPQNQGQQGGVPHQAPQTFVRGPHGYVPANQANSNVGQGGNTLGNNQGGSSNCRGQRRNRPECNVNTAPVRDTNVLNAFQSISWLARLSPDRRSVGLPSLPGTPSAQAQSRNFLLGVDEPDRPFQTCSTPRFEPGHCRFLQHCIQQEFIHSFQAFLQYVCFIEGKFIGVCCPDSRYPQSTTTSTTSTTTTTTPRPATPPSTRGCGLSKKQSTRIVGGRPADPQEWPWMAALLRGTSTQYCGGVLISNRHVLTAAHCVEGFSSSQVTVRLGEYTFDSPDESAHHDYPVQSIQKHAGYNTTTFVNDIAILTISQAAAFNDDIWPICLPSAGPIYVGEVPTVTGWGTIYYGGPVATTLQEVTIPVWTNKDCDDTYEQTIVDTVLCAGAKTGGKDSCQGDSGGPLQLRQSASGRWEVIGVVSWGIRCAEPGFPGVYTRVNRYLNWIRQNSI